MAESYKWPVLDGGQRKDVYTQSYIQASDFFYHSFSFTSVTPVFFAALFAVTRSQKCESGTQIFSASRCGLCSLIIFNFAIFLYRCFLFLFFFFLLTVRPLSPTKYNGDVWPQDGLQQTRVSRVLPNTHHGNVSLIPLRGSENEMRNSVAAFSQDPLSVSEPTNQWN